MEVLDDDGEWRKGWAYYRQQLADGWWKQRQRCHSRSRRNGIAGQSNRSEDGSVNRVNRRGESMGLRDFLRRRPAASDNEQRRERQAKRAEKAYEKQQRKQPPYDPDRPGPADPTGGAV